MFVVRLFVRDASMIILTYWYLSEWLIVFPLFFKSAYQTDLHVCLEQVQNGYHISACVAKFQIIFFLCFKFKWKLNYISGNDIKDAVMITHLLSIV